MSDLDVWVIVKDEFIETISAERQRYAAQVDQSVLVLESPRQEGWRTTLLPSVHRVEQMAMLREIAREMEQLTSAIELIGGQVPSRAIPYVYAFFDLADALILQG